MRFQGYIHMLLYVFEIKESKSIANIGLRGCLAAAVWLACLMGHDPLVRFSIRIKYEW